jgi:CubicO group peptidase (beta-lactamase class C family)
MRVFRLAGILLALLAQPPYSIAQDLSQRVDRIFADLNLPGSPGCSLGVVRDGGFVYRKSYGEASLELGVPLSSQSVFYVGSVSKQFTATAIVLAAEQGFLSLDDDVRKYIPELPNYGHTVTLRQMLHQTSGLRDFFDLIYLSGIDVASFNSPAAILKLIERQSELNNVPGDEWIYSNTNYFLLGIALERATKKPLSQFAAENIFHPLGMAHTRFYDDASLVVPGRVAAYDADPSAGFRVDWSTNYAVVGGGGLMTTVDDLLAWDNNFYANHLGKGMLLKDLETTGLLNNGKRTNYGMGLIIGNYRGLRIVEHNGALFGYRADLLRFPEERFTLVCLCNLANADPEDRSRKVADLYLDGKFPSALTPPAPAGGGLPDPAIFAGRYLDPRSHTIDSFTAKDGLLWAWGSALRRKSGNEFYDRFGDVITFASPNGQMNAKLDINGKAFFSGQRVGELHVDESALQAFTGNYRSAELDSTMQISLDRATLRVRNGGNAPLTLNPIAQDEFAADSFSIVFRHDENGRVTELRVFTPAARGIAFNRVN